MKEMKVGFLGAGDISLLHAEAVAACPGATLKGIWNRTRSKAEEKAAIFGCSVYDTAEELCADPELDAVFVMTNMETHRDFAVMALDAGKHVLVEKPTATTVEEIEDIKAASEKSGKQCMPVHNYIYEDSVRRAKELLEEGKLGDLVSVYVLYNIHHPEAVAARYPGVIRQILTHHSYILLYMAGNPVSVSAMKATVNDGTVPQENIAMATLKMESGGLAHLCASFANDDHAGDPWTCMIKVIGTKGSTRYSYRDWVENTPATVHSQTYSAYPYTIRQTGQYFLEKVVREGAAPLSTLDDAITCQRMIEGCEASIEQGRHISLA